MAYTPHTAPEISRMLDVIGVDDVAELFAGLPPEVRLAGELDLPPGLSEQEVRRVLAGHAAANLNLEELTCFLGGGVYDTVIPAAIDALAGRSEFLTAYTPYQAEVSQGTLQVIYEWQTYVCRLTGLEVANASLYDGATALAEAACLAVARRRRRRILLPELLNPRYRRVVATMMEGLEVEILDAPATAAGTTDPDALADLADDEVAGVVIQNPNYLGLIEPVAELSAAAQRRGALLIACVNPISLSVVKPPGQYGAQLAVGEAQPFGLPCSFGGPLLGFFAAAAGLQRNLPGRVVGRTRDRQGRDAYVLTLQTREQHIRREKATSNICTNQGLMALRATVYLALLGAEGFRELGAANRTRCEALRAAVARVGGVEIPFAGPVFNEFVIRLPQPAAAFCRFARDHGLLAGIPLDGFPGCGERDLLVAVTEKRTAADIRRYGELLAQFLAGGPEGRE